jgi:FixJ family two-component response regulator
MPDCVVLDFQMPGLTGRDIQRALSVAKLPLPIIIVTAHDQPSLREKVLADGAVAYFTKPLRRDTLIAAVDQAIRRAP